jgi:hypothetical protein
MAAGLCRPWQPLPWRLKLALPAQVRLELGEHAQHVQQALAGGRAGVDPLLQYRAARRDSANDVLKVSDASGEAIDAGDKSGRRGAHPVPRSWCRSASLPG